MALISVKNLTFNYPGKCALSDVSFLIEPQTVTALVGPNGAGKSTLMRCMAGLNLPVQGSIFMDNLDVLNFPRAAHATMGYLPDAFGLYDDLTVEQCLRYYGMVHNVPRHALEDTLQSTAQSLQIVPHLNQAVGTLSRGQRQRLAIAQTLIHKPKVLLLDEPATNLDPEARQHLAQIFKDLQTSGVTLIVSSHILAELQEYCTHMLVLREGRIVAHSDIQSATKNMMDVYLATAGTATTTSETKA